MPDLPPVPDQTAVVAMLEDVWSSLLGVAGDLDDADFARPTDCPGWTVKDQLAHVAALESQLAGRPQPEHQAPDAPWVRNDFARITEVGVDYRRPWPPGEVVAELADLTAERSRQLRALTAEEWAADSWTPVGPGSYGLFMAVRVVDCWAHEQDVRRAVDRPGHLTGPAPEHVVDRLLGALPMVVARRAAAPDGSVVALHLTGPVERSVAVGVEGSKGRRLADVPDQATTTLAMGSESYAVLAMGRQAAEDRPDVQVRGDETLGRAVLANLNTMT